MTLHKVIERLLIEANGPLKASKIARLINENNLYVRKDGMEVSSSQIHSRVNNYSKLFGTENGKIKLVKGDPVNIKFNKYRNLLSHRSPYRNESHQDVLVKILDELIEDNKRANDLITYKRNLLVAYRIIRWYNQVSGSKKSFFSENIINLVSGLSIWKNQSNRIVMMTDEIDSILLKIVADQAEYPFKIKEIFGLDLMDNLMGDLGGYNSVTRLINSFNSPHKEGNFSNVAIFIPSLQINSLKKRQTIIDDLLNYIDTNPLNLKYGLVFLPIMFLMGSGASNFHVRRRIVESGYLDSVISFSEPVLENYNTRFGLLIFDFKEKKEEIFFVESSEKLIDGKFLNDIISEKEIVKNVSRSIKHSELRRFELNAHTYVFDVDDIFLKPNHKLFKIGELIQDKKIGYGIKERSRVYSGGECKLIRNADIDESYPYVDIDKDYLGVDFDQLDGLEKHLISGGAVFGTFNKSVKGIILEDNKDFILGQNLYWLKFDENYVLYDYVIEELKRPYLKKQINYYSTGSTIPKLNLSSLLELKIQIPVSKDGKPDLDKQIKILYKEENNSKKNFDLGNINSREKDFIKTLEHTIKQPLGTLTNDFSSLDKYLRYKIDRKKIIEINEIIVPQFNTDSNEEIKRYSLSNTLERMERALTDMDYVLKQAKEIISINEAMKESFKLKEFLKDIASEYNQINFKILGKEFEVYADKRQFRIMIHNFIDNAVKHGFKDEIKNPTIWLELNSKDPISINLSIRNNGLPLPPEFTTSDFLAKGSSLNSDVGSGFGGFLIGLILKNHNGNVKLNNIEEGNLLPYNIEFLITLPK